MLPAIRIDETARVTEPAIIEAALAHCAYRLPGAIPNVWQQPGWHVLEQAYDLEDVYVSYMEITVDNDRASIPIHCPMNDLYWLYVLFGKLRIADPATGKAILSEQARRYRLNYLPAGGYDALFKPGHHQLFYAVHKPSSLFREDSDEFTLETDVFNALKEQPCTPVKTDSLSMSDGSLEAIRRFLTSPGKTALKRRQAIQYLSWELVFRTYDSFALKSGGKTVGAEWADHMKVYIDECIETGERVDTGKIAEHARVSERYVRFIFEKNIKKPVAKYITQRKLTYAKTLMDNGCTPTEAANFLELSYSHFSASFTEAFGISPSAYRKRNTR